MCCRSNIWKFGSTIALGITIIALAVSWSTAVHSDPASGRANERDETLAPSVKFAPAAVATGSSAIRRPAETAGWPEGFSRLLSNTSGTDFTNAMYSTAVGDLDRDGFLEIFALRSDGYIYGFDCYGGDLPGFPLDLVALAGFTNEHNTTGHIVALGDLDGNGVQEIVAGVRLLDIPESRMFVLDMYGNVYDWWPKQGVPAVKILKSTPTIWDLDQDGLCEIIFGSGDVPAASYLYVLKHDGVTLNGNFPLVFPGSFNTSSSVAVGDLDEDNYEEIIFLGGDFQVHAINHQDASEVPGWPVAVSGFRNSVAVGDVNGDGNLEVVVVEDNSSPGQVTVLNADGSVLPGWPQTFPGTGDHAGSPSLVDLDDDGGMEILFGGRDWVNIFRADGTLFPGWPQAVDTLASSSIISSNVTVADVNGDGIKEVLYVEHGPLLYVWSRDGYMLEPFPMDFSQPPLVTNCWSTPVIADMQSDGDVDLVLTFFHMGALGHPEDHIAEVTVVDLAYDYQPEWRDWVTFHRDHRHTGAVPLDSSTPVTEPPPASLVPVLILAQNHPNPFNPHTTLTYFLPEAGHVSLSIFDVRGRLIARLIDRQETAGRHMAVWNGQNRYGRAMPAGTYFARLVMGPQVCTCKMILTR
ncbi:MAG: T9SS type A sorting domain-containing protein [bacterium]|nr:MAG: T9SS type A sorting domain-containing protein [bacterium]